MINLKYRKITSMINLLHSARKEHTLNRPFTLSHGGHVESQENKKLCSYTASLALNSRLGEACRPTTKLLLSWDSTWPPNDEGLLRLESRLYGTMNGSWDVHLASPVDFAGADDIITNLAKEGEPGIEIIERAPLSLIITRHAYALETTISNYPYLQISTFVHVYFLLQHLQPCSGFTVRLLSPKVSSIHHL